jgi:hypothetical protein
MLPPARNAAPPQKPAQSAPAAHLATAPKSISGPATGATQNIAATVPTASSTNLGFANAGIAIQRGLGSSVVTSNGRVSAMHYETKLTNAKVTVDVLSTGGSVRVIGTPKSINYQASGDISAIRVDATKKISIGAYQVTYHPFMGIGRSIETRGKLNAAATPNTASITALGMSRATSYNPELSIAHYETVNNKALVFGRVIVPVYYGYEFDLARNQTPH